MKSLLNDNMETSNLTLTPEFIESQLERFDVTAESLKQIVEPYKELKIADVNDRDGYVQVREARLALKAKRVQIEKSGKELRDNANKFAKAVITREKELIAILEPEEQRLKSEEQRYEEEKERLRQEEERKETERIQERIKHLAQYNYAIDFYEAKIMPEDAFQKLLLSAQQDYAQEQERIAAEKVAEEQRRREEEERMRREREELERLKAEQLKREQELEAERRELQRQQQEKEAVIRAEQERQRKEYEAQQAELRKEREAIEADKRRIEMEQAKKEAAERARLEEIERQKREEEARIERERQAEQERKRQEALRPFKDKMLDFADRVQNLCLETPTSSDENGAKLYLEVNDFLTKLSEHIKTKVKSL
jgi:hypothetical protein